MTGPLEAVVREMFSRLDDGDYDAGLQTVAADVQAVDEVSRHWLRGHEELRAYLTRLRDVVQDVRSTVGDVRETMLGDVGVVTCWLEQDYTIAGQRTHVSAPTTAVLVREGDAWRISLLHSIPLVGEG